MMVEQLIQDESLVAAYELLDQFFEFILKKFSYIRKHKDCPTDINEAISSIIFASARFGDFPELYPIRKLFVERYGKDFETEAIELFPGNHVNTELKENLSVKSVPHDLKYRVVDEITRDNALQIKMKEHTENQLIESDSQIIHTKESKRNFTSESTVYDTPELLDYVDDIDECEYFSSKDGGSHDQRLVLYKSSESDIDDDESISYSSISSYAARKRASKKRLRRRSPLLERQGTVEIGYTLHYLTPSPYSSYPKKRFKQHSNNSQSCETNSLDYNMSDCSSCNLESPCYCFVYIEIEMFEYFGSSSTNVLNSKTCDFLTSSPYSSALTVTSKWPENCEDNSFSCRSPQPKHVHPKLPDYDNVVATFKALKTVHA
ncbi:uncharacterized protein [Cicer arietinum]|uniref:uncharacterized protein n=1 Tax=Cicer arietinum TaxID=3827 RepID=UPI003CC5CBC6